MGCALAGFSGACFDRIQDRLLISQQNGETQSQYFYTGCQDFPERENVLALLNKIWEPLDVESWQKER